MHNTVHEFEWVPHLILPYLVNQLGIGGDDIHLYRGQWFSDDDIPGECLAWHGRPSGAARADPRDGERDRQGQLRL
jgi:hypothetical protein